MNREGNNTMTEIIAAAKEKGFSSDQILTAFAKTLDEMEPIAKTEKMPETNGKMVLTEQELTMRVSETMHQIGVPAHIKGYKYLRTAIILSVKDSKMMESVTKTLYPTVAREFSTTPSRVERAIRHAIEVAWDRGDVDVLSSYFGYTIQSGRGKPTNSEFIAMLSDKLRLKVVVE